MSESIYRKAINKILVDKVKVVVVDIPNMEFAHMDKLKNGWRLTISKSLLED
jgi:hypothetical protein